MPDLDLDTEEKITAFVLELAEIALGRCTEGVLLGPSITRSVVNEDPRLARLTFREREVVSNYVLVEAGKLFSAREIERRRTSPPRAKATMFNVRIQRRGVA